jgi:hypothetical protein
MQVNGKDLSAIVDSIITTTGLVVFNEKLINGGRSMKWCNVTATAAQLKQIEAKVKKLYPNETLEVRNVPPTPNGAYGGVRVRVSVTYKPKFTERKDMKRDASLQVSGGEIARIVRNIVPTRGHNVFRTPLVNGGYSLKWQKLFVSQQAMEKITEALKKRYPNFEVCVRSVLNGGTHDGLRTRVSVRF